MGRSFGETRRSPSETKAKGTPLKSFFGINEIEYLGHTISQEGIKLIVYDALV